MPEVHLKFVTETHNWRDRLGVWLWRLGAASLFIYIGMGKFASRSEWVGIFEEIGFGQWFRYFTGIFQISGGILVLFPKTFPFGIAILATTMLGAMCAWVFLLGSPVTAVLPALFFLALLAIGGQDLFGLGARICKRR